MSRPQQNDQEQPSASASSPTTAQRPSTPAQQQQPERPASASASSSARTPRPSGCQMPAPPIYTNTTRSPSASGMARDRSGQGPGQAQHASSPSQHISGQREPRRTPTSEGGHSPGFSPTSQSGPLSPSHSSNAFVFPIRSVFQNKSHSGQGGEGSIGGSAASRPPSDGRPSPLHERRFSQSIKDDAGIATIQQLLEQGSSEPRERKRPTGQSGGVATATFSGKVDRSASGSGQGSGSTPEPPKPVKPASAGLPGDSGHTEPHDGFFSMPSMGDREPARNPFFDDGARRQSVSTGHLARASSQRKSQQQQQQQQQDPPQRPQPEERISDQTATPEHPNPENPSADAKGSGLTDPDRPPVGQPTHTPPSSNYHHRPGGENIETATSFRSHQPSKPTRRGPTPETTASSTPKPQQVPTAPKPAESAQETRETTQAGIQHPKPQSVGKGGMPGLGGSDTSGSLRGTSANFELDESGEQTLIQDFAGIVRLGEPGSLSSKVGTGAGTGTGTGTGTGSGVGSKSRTSATGSGQSAAAPGAPPSLARAQRRSARDNTQDSVRRFVDSQANTVNLADPNAPTPTPTPHGGDEEAEAIAEEQDVPDTPPPRPPIEDTPVSTSSTPAEGNNEKQPQQPQQQQQQEWTESSEASMSVRDSSEMATASAEDAAPEEEEEPIVTFRFEHSQNEDGHHVVVGREGKLRRCEDEPITTPGAVQGFGVLIVLEEDYESGDLVVRQVSENATELLGLSPKYLFRLSCFTRILTTDQEDLLRDNLEYLPDPSDPDTGRQGVAEEGPQVFLLSGYGEPGSDEAVEEDDASDVAGRRREWTCWVAAHRPAQPNWNKTDSMGQATDPPDLIILEFELERDPYNPLMQPFESQYYSSTSGVGSGRSGGATPDSSSQTTASAGSRGSMPDRSTSFGSGEDSAGSVTTVGTTPRPGLSQSDSGTATAGADPKASSSGATYSGSRASARPDHMKPQGLEGVEMEMPLDRIIESTTNHAKPLRALERMRRTGMHNEGSTEYGSGSGSTSRRGGRARRPPRRAQGGSTGTMDVFAVLGQINEQLGSAPDLETFLKITVGVVQDLCRFHRVLIYQFDESYNGQVVAELVEWGKTTDLFKGLMFPAADIPAQARQLYAINKVRLLYDRSQTTARMVLRSKDDLDHPLDMTHCYLRAMSPIHIKYLQNMHVRSSMSVSIMAFGQLWGLIACHSYGHHGMRVSFPVRQMMRLLSDSISKNIERLSYAQRLHTRKLISTIPTQHHPTGYIVSNADDLLQIFDAESGLLVIGDGCKLLGNNEQGQAMLSIAEYLRVMKFDTMRSSSHIKRDFPDLVLPRAEDTIAGLLYVPLTAKAGQDFIVFLRKGQSREVQWAGKPYKDEQANESASLEPRKSFKTWSETVTGRSRAWTDDQLESAGVLALIYGKFIQVWREKQSAMASNQLTAILLSNTSHAVRTPLSQIINTLELALSGDIDADTRNMLENSHQASRALLFHVHDLLDLTRIETGNETAFNDPFDLRKTVHDAVRLYENESKRRGLEFRVNISDDLPQSVIGDSRKVKTVISNLVANSVKFTESGFIDVTVGTFTPTSGQEVIRAGHVPIEMVISDSGCGIATEKLERMFVTLEGADEVAGEQSQSPTGLGLGLAVVARIVEQLGGQLRAESEVDVGSKFFFTSQMLEHTGGTIATMGTTDHSKSVRSRESSARSDAVSRARTGSSGSGSVVSYRSGGSAHASEIDSFVNDFGASHMLAPVAPNDKRLRDAEERMSRPGTFPVTDSSYPVRPSKMESDMDSNASGTSPPPGSVPSSPKQIQRPSMGTRRSTQAGHKSQAAITAPPQPQRSASLRNPLAEDDDPSSVSGGRAGHKPKLRVLVVEDDAINSQILQKRLKMDKHAVKAVTNGQEAVDCLAADWAFDAVLMDIQMPIMDGRTAAKEIRKLEAKPDHADNDDKDALRVDNRIPIFAVSASLYESDRENLSADFDGWLLKPLDFSRVRVLLSGLQDPAKRDAEVFVQGQWERGGYFHGSSRK